MNDNLKYGNFNNLEGQSQLLNILEKRAGFWIRLLAIWIDGAVVNILTMLLSFVLFGKSVTEFLHLSPTALAIAYSELIIRSFIINILISMCYETILIGYNGQTIGKLLTRIKVLNLDNTQPSYSKAFARFFSKWLSILTFCIGYLLVAFRKDKRGLHDLIVDTKVVKLGKSLKEGTVQILKDNADI